MSMLHYTSINTFQSAEVMKAFQVLWTPPLYQRTWGGLKATYRRSRIDNMFSDYYLLTMLLSVIQWKKFHKSSIKLYGDVNVINYLSKFNLLGLWDEYDSSVLQDLDQSIDPTCFYSAGKFYAYLQEPAPCILLDLDLVTWASLDPFLSGIAVGFTHWEATSPPTYWYCPKAELKIPEGYVFPSSWNWQLMAANTSLVYFSNEVLKNYYAEQAIRYMVNNKIGGDFNLIKPELLFVDQRLLPICIYELGMMDKMRLFIDTVWSPSLGRFINHDPQMREWHFYELRNQPLLTHIWIAKQHIEKKPKYRNYYCHQLLESIFSEYPELEGRLSKIQCLQKHLLLYGRQGELETRRYFSYNLHTPKTQPQEVYRA